jgi:hypothetical protein
VLQGVPIAEATLAARTALPADRRAGALRSAVPAASSRSPSVSAEFRQRRRVQRQLVEYSLAVREDLSSTQFYAGDAYYRGVLDLGYLFDDDSIALVDHKTGMRVPGTAITDQLEGYAVLAGAAFRGVRQFWLGVHWIAERAVEWGEPLGRGTVHDQLVPNLLDNIEAAALAVDDGPRPNPGSYCDRCSYRARCPAARTSRTTSRSSTTMMTTSPAGGAG